MVQIPVWLKDFDLVGFEEYLEREGALVLSPTNPYEVIRYRTKEVKLVDENVVSERWTTHIVYRKDIGRLTYTSWSGKHYKDFLRNWSLGAEAPKISKKKKKGAGVQPSKQGLSLLDELLERDGTLCWFCDQYMEIDNLSVEHLLPKSIKAGNCRENLCLAHKSCNSMAANKPLVEKIELRLELHRLTETGEYEP